MNSYLYCPMQCKIQFIDRIKVEPSEALIRGIGAHKALELYYDNIDVDALYNNYKSEITRAMFLSDEGKKWREYVMGFYSWEIIRASHCIKYEKDFETYFIPKYRELRIENKEHNLVGYIDRIDTLFTDKLALFDYKSKEPKDKVPIELPEPLQEEMVFYHILYDSVDVDMLGILYTHTQNPLRKVVVSDTLINKVFNLINIVRDSIDMELFPYADTMHKCNMCDYKDVCSRFNKGAGK